jgi:hypothetical protein
MDTDNTGEVAPEAENASVTTQCVNLARGKPHLAPKSACIGVHLRFPD